MALYDYDPRESSPNIDVEVGQLPAARSRSLGLSPHGSRRPWDLASPLLWKGPYTQ